MTAGPQPPRVPPALEQALATILGETDAAARQDKIRRLQAQHPAHRDYVERWLHQHSIAAETLAPDRDEKHDLNEVEERTIGPYTLVERIGKGGMGEVFVAEQKEPVQRRVALKLIKVGMDSEATIQRFRRERQVLAAMNHEAIAKVFDAGIASHGRPYFVMEYVEGGKPITDYCDEHRLSIPERIGLFQAVCLGVQHSHQKAVLHRDLKPANILVRKVGDRHVPKIIDFGLAKAIAGQDLDDGASVHSVQGDLMGTLAYMPPEQAAGDPDLDTRIDIYSLGVVLYELLSGVLPFDLWKLSKAERVRRIREEEPKKPSTKITEASATTTATVELAMQRRLRSVHAWSRVVQGDLDWIVLKAIAKEKERRYASATEFAEDLQRYLDHEPVRARAPSLGYRVSKFVRRYRGPMLAAGAVLVALISTFVQYLRAEERAADALLQKGKAEVSARLATLRAEENAKLAQEKGELAAAEAKAKGAARKSADTAENRAKELEQVLTFQEEQWAEVDPATIGWRLRSAVLANIEAERRAEVESSLAGVNFTDLARRMLQENLFDRSLAAIGRGFAQQPLVKARLLQNVANTLRDLGLVDRAMSPQTEALEIRRHLLGDSDPDTLPSIGNMGLLLWAKDKLTEAEPLLREALVESRRVLGDGHAHTLTSINNLVLLLTEEGKFTEAEPLLREALVASRRVLGDDHKSTLTLIGNLGSLLQAQGKLTEAEPFLREALENRRRVLGETHSQTLISLINLGTLLTSQDKLNDAEPLLCEALATSRRVLGDDHPHSLEAITSMGMLFKAQHRLSEAETLLRESLERHRRVLGDDHSRTLTSIQALGDLLQELRQFAEAEHFFRESLEGYRRVRGEDNPNTLICIQRLGSLLLAQDKLSEAEPLFREGLTTSRRVLGDDNPETMASIGSLASLLVAQNNLTEAEPLFREALATSRRVLGDGHAHTLASINNMGYLLQQQGKLAEAEPLLREVLEAFRHIRGDDHADTLIAIGNLGSLLQAQGKLTEAEPLLREVLEKRRRDLGEGHPQTLTSINNMGYLLQQQGKLTEAEPLLREAIGKRRQVLRDGHPHTLISIINLAYLLQQQGRLAEAEPLLREALETRRRDLGDDHPATLTSINDLGGLLVRTGRHRDAVALLSATEATARTRFSGEHTCQLAAFLRTLGKAHAGLAQPRDFASAEALLLEAHTIFTRSRGRTHKETHDCTQAIIELYNDWHVANPGNGHDQQAAEWKAKLAPSPEKESAK